jgi:DNA-binding CsgD family transcriptional regulator
LDEHVIRALLNLASNLIDERRYREATRYVDEGIAYASGRELGSYGSLLLVARAFSDLRRGAWQRADEIVRPLAARGSKLPLIRVTALVIAGVLRARRGEPGAQAALDAALALAAPEEPQQCGSVAAARAEAAWLDGRPEGVLEATDRTLALAADRDDRRLLAELACWRARAGVVEAVAVHPDDPYALELAGEWKAAALRWRQLGCPYEAALAQLRSEDEATLEAALVGLRQLGATCAAAKAAERMRALGMRPLRGPRAATLANPAGLTARQLDVLALLCDGLRNADIAHRLYISPKTVDHHVSAVLHKLGVRSRHDVGGAAQELGLVVSGGDR